MHETFGRQIFGIWYDVLFYVGLSWLFFYLGCTLDRMTPSQKEKVPSFMLNKKFCFSIGVLAGLLAFVKLLA
jgi:hypothetical protein